MNGSGDGVLLFSCTDVIKVAIFVDNIEVMGIVTVDISSITCYTTITDIVWNIFVGGGTVLDWGIILTLMVDAMDFFG